MYKVIGIIGKENSQETRITGNLYHKKLISWETCVTGNEDQVKTTIRENTNHNKGGIHTEISLRILQLNGIGDTKIT
jgi:hypothetical protein